MGAVICLASAQSSVLLPCPQFFQSPQRGAQPHNRLADFPSSSGQFGKSLNIYSSGPSFSSDSPSPRARRLPSHRSKTPQLVLAAVLLSIQTQLFGFPALGNGLSESSMGSESNAQTPEVVVGTIPIQPDHPDKTERQLSSTSCEGSQGLESCESSPNNVADNSSLPAIHYASADLILLVVVIVILMIFASFVIAPSVSQISRIIKLKRDNLEIENRNLKIEFFRITISLLLAAITITQAIVNSQSRKDRDLLT